MVSQTIPGGRGSLSSKGSWRIHCPVKGWGTICRTRGQAGKARLKGHNLQPSRSATVVEVKVFLRFGGSEICQKPLFRDEKGFFIFPVFKEKSNWVSLSYMISYDKVGPHFWYLGPDISRDLVTFLPK